MVLCLPLSIKQSKYEEVLIMTNTLINRANAAHTIIMEIFYDDLFNLTDGASSTILEAANKVADPVGDQLTEKDLKSTINGLISELLAVSDFRYNSGIEKLRELL
jgi:hypothetical protein